MDEDLSKHVRKLTEGMIEKFPIWFFAARWLLLLSLVSVPFAFAWSLIR
ncbi:hypothetical protein [uncultured Parasutterella sp.]|nr:hypothetical protein [uncultured Parasutterella sp.]